MSKRNVKFASDGASTAPNEYSYWLKLLFRSVCGLLAMTTVLKELRRYMDNNDKPVISFRKFNVNPFVGKVSLQSIMKMQVHVKLVNSESVFYATGHGA